MKKTIITLLLGITAGTALAQKLSPATEVYLMQKEQARQRITAANPQAQTATDDTVKAFLRISSDEAIGRLEALGIRPVHLTDDVLTAAIPLGMVRQVAEISEITRIEKGDDVRPLMNEARRKTGVSQVHKTTDPVLPQQYLGKDVVVGIVDNGFEYGHAAFYGIGGSPYRVKRVWDQSFNSGRGPAAFGYGTEFVTQEEILSARYDMSSSYHGMHVAGIAAGGDNGAVYYGVAPGSDIVLVSYASSATDVANGVRYIMDYAKSVGKPCVINMSVGIHNGPHDGTSITDKVFESLSGAGNIIVGAVGNEGDTALHASKQFAENDTVLKTFITLNSSKAALVDAWGDVGADFRVVGLVVDELKGKILAHTDTVSTKGLTTKNFKFTMAECGMDATVTISCQRGEYNNRPNAYIGFTVTGLGTNRRMGLAIIGKSGEKVDLWNASYTEFSAAGKAGWTEGDTHSTCSELGGTGRGIISVGCWQTKNEYTTLGGVPMELNLGTENGSVSSFSSQGPTLDGRMKPEIVAPGMCIVSAISSYYDYFEASECAGRSKKGDNYYYYAANGGTSMAAPFITGTIALWLEANPQLSPEDIRGIFSRTAQNDEFTAAAKPGGAGYGKIDAYAGLVDILGLTGINSPVLTDRTADGSTARYAEITADRRSRTVSLRFNATPCDAPLCVKAYTADGREILCQPLGICSTGSRRTLNLPASSGIYIIQIETETGSNGMQQAKIAM